MNTTQTAGKTAKISFRVLFDWIDPAMNEGSTDGFATFQDAQNFAIENVNSKKHNKAYVEEVLNSEGDPGNINIVWGQCDLCEKKGAALSNTSDVRNLDLCRDCMEDYYS